MTESEDRTSPTQPGARPAAQPTARRKLGKGLGALLGETRREAPLGVGSGERGQQGSAGQSTAGAGANAARREDGLAMLAVADIEPHPDQPRRHFDEAALVELAASISARGVIQPIIVRRRSSGSFQLVAGERRWRAAQKAQLHEIPALIRELEERDVMALALIENVQREDLNPVEEARAYARLAEMEDMTQAQIAELVDKSRSHVANLQRLLTLPESVLDYVEQGQLDMGHARALVGHDDAEALARQAVEKKLSVREVEKLARKTKDGGARQRRAREPREAGQDADIVAVQNHLEEFLGLPVKISADADPRSGSVTVRYRTLDQLDLICQRLTNSGI